MIAYEQAVIGAIMIDPACYYQVADIISPDDFAHPANRVIFSAIAKMCRESQPVDPVTMGDVLPDHTDYLMNIAMNTASSANVRAYAEGVQKESESRRVKSAGQRIAADDCTFEDAQKILAEAAPRSMSSLRPVKEYMQEALQVMQDRCDRQEAITGLPTGLKDLDEATSGLQPGTLNILAARPSMGKSSAAMQIAVRTALRKKRVVVFSMEMTGVQLSERAVSLISRVPYGFIRSPKLLQEEHWPRITDAYAKLGESCLVIDDSSSQRAETICARARQLHMQSPLSLVVIDHLGWVKLPGKNRPDLETSNVTKALKELSKDLAIPVLLLVQLNRSLEQRADKRPMMSDLRESGGIEEDADVVMMLYRDEYYHPNSPHKGYAECILRKNREGMMCTIPLQTHLDVMRFDSCDGLPHVESPRKTYGFSANPDFRSQD